MFSILVSRTVPIIYDNRSSLTIHHQMRFYFSQTQFLWAQKKSRWVKMSNFQNYLVLRVFTIILDSLRFEMLWFVFKNILIISTLFHLNPPSATAYFVTCVFRARFTTFLSLFARLPFSAHPSSGNFPGFLKHYTHTDLLLHYSARGLGFRDLVAASIGSSAPKKKNARSIPPAGSDWFGGRKIGIPRDRKDLHGKVVGRTRGRRWPIFDTV